MKENIFPIVLLIAAVLGAVMIFGAPGGEHELVGKPAPEIELATLDGGVFVLSEHRGENIVMLDFWATWCGPCRSSMPAVASVAEEFSDKGVVLYTVNQNESAAEVQRFLDSLGLDVNVAMDTAFQAARPYLVTGIPMLVIVGKDGIVQAVHVGAGPGTKSSLRRQLDRLVRGESLVRGR